MPNLLAGSVPGPVKIQGSRGSRICQNSIGFTNLVKKKLRQIPVCSVLTTLLLGGWSFHLRLWRALLRLLLLLLQEIPLQSNRQSPRGRVLLLHHRQQHRTIRETPRCQQESGVPPARLLQDRYLVYLGDVMHLPQKVSVAFPHRHRQMITHIQRFLHTTRIPKKREPRLAGVGEMGFATDTQTTAGLHTSLSPVISGDRACVRMTRKGVIMSTVKSRTTPQLLRNQFLPVKPQHR